MKKKIPTTVWTTIQPLLDKYQEYFTTVESEEYALYLKDIDVKSDFYFLCSKQKGDGTFSITYKPAGENNVNMITHNQVELQQLANHLGNWTKVLKIYDEIPTFYDDDTFKAKRKARFQKQYQQAYYKDLALDEEDADTAPFDNKRQLLLSAYLNDVKGLLGEASENTNDEAKKEELKTISDDCEELQETLVSITKNEALQRLAYIWAKVHLFGLPLLRAVMIKFGEGAIGFLGEKSVEFSGLLDMFKGIF